MCGIKKEGPVSAQDLINGAVSLQYLVCSAFFSTFFSSGASMFRSRVFGHAP
jgi:hypothetical protein